MLTKQQESHPTSSYIFFLKCLYFKQELENPQCLSENDHWAELKLSAKFKNTLVNTVVGFRATLIVSELHVMKVCCHVSPSNKTVSRKC